MESFYRVTDIIRHSAVFCLWVDVRCVQGPVALYAMLVEPVFTVPESFVYA
jgi:hypothetical protein